MAGAGTIPGGASIMAGVTVAGSEQLNIEYVYSIPFFIYESQCLKSSVYYGPHTLSDNES